MRFTRFYLVALLAFSSMGAFAQTQDEKLEGVGLRSITTAVPFLTLAPDARSGALGDAGVALSPDAMANHWNSARLAFIENDIGFSVSYNPWLRKLVNDMSLSYLTGYKRLSEQEVLSMSLTYFDLGSITFTNDQGGVIGEHRPKEFAAGLNYSRKLSEKLGVGVGLKFIHSNLAGNYDFQQTGPVKPGNTAAGDIGVFYTNDYMVSGKNLQVNFGANISNLGAKISYSNSEQNSFIPTTLRLGTAVTGEINPFNKITIIAEASKLLAPTPPIYYADSTDDDSNPVIKEGKDPNRPLLSGVLGSFADAPGGFSEEMQEVILHFGLEYWYHDAAGNPLFAVRGGYFRESPDKGDRQYFTLGFGLRYQVFGADFAYLVPTERNNPLAESLRFSLLFNFDTNKQQESITE